MKVLHVIPAVAPRYGGPSQVVLAMARALTGRGLDVVVATTDADGSGRLPVPYGVTRPYRGVPAIFFERKYGDRFKYSPGLARWLARTVPTFDIVHIHAVFSHSSLAAARACRSADVPYLVRPLGSLDPWSLRQRPLVKRLLLVAGARKMLQQAVAVHFTSTEEQRLAGRGIPGLNGVVVPLGVDEEAFLDRAVATGTRDRMLLIVARLHPKKNVEGLIEAFARLTAEGSAAGWRLVVAGDGNVDYRRRLEQRARGAGLSGQVEFVGWVGERDKRALLARASVFTLPSHQENFGVSVLEAMAAGVPVVVTRGVNLAPDVERAGAGWVIGHGLDDLTMALRAAMSDAGECARRGAAGRRLAETYRWPAIAEALDRMYRGILGAQGVAEASAAVPVPRSSGR